MSHSRKPLISCLRDVKKQDATHFQTILDSLQQLLDKNIDDQTMAIPLLRTYEYLIHSGMLDTVGVDFRTRLLQKFWDSTRKTEDVRKITACSQALCAALRFEGEFGLNPKRRIIKPFLLPPICLQICKSTFWEC